jgi:hypothetical protein
LLTGGGAGFQTLPDAYQPQGVLLYLLQAAINPIKTVGKGNFDLTLVKFGQRSLRIFQIEAGNHPKPDNKQPDQ